VETGKRTEIDEEERTVLAPTFFVGAVRPMGL